VINVKLQNLKNYFINIISFIRIHLQNARIANHLNISIDQLNDILKRNEIGEHKRYDEVMLLMYNSSSIITDDIINHFLDEPL
jgi:hypothetical protein